MERLYDTIQRGYGTPHSSTPYISFYQDVDLYHYVHIGGGDKHYEVTVHGNKYVVKIRTYKNDRTDKEVEYSVISLDNTASNCITIIVNKDGDHADIQGVQKNPVCGIQVDKQGNMTPLTEKTGSVMMWIAIEWCKYKGVKVIRLIDNGQIRCGGDASFQLSMAYIMTHGYPWYSKFGFEYRDEITRRDYNHNIELFKKALTKHIPMKKLLKFSPLSEQIINKYNELSDKPASKFIKWLQHYDCTTFASIYDVIYNELGYRSLSKTYMVLDLWPQRVELDQVVRT
jgi:hypothetical protein